MLQCIVKIKLIQVTAYADASGNSIPRNEIFDIDSCHSFEVYSSWKSLSDTATIEIPKNIYVKDANNNNIMWGESTTPDRTKGYISAGGFANPQASKAPLIMRGDEIIITAGYSYISKVNTDGTLTYASTTNNVFHGFVSSLESKSTLKIHCEDFMWLLKQTTMPSKIYTSPENDINDVLNDIVKASNLVNNEYLITADTGGFTLGVEGFSTGNESAAVALNKLKKILPSLAFYFRDGTLRGGGVVYYPRDQSAGTDNTGNPLYSSFNFQKNIISHQLQYSLKNDVKVAALCYSISSLAQNQQQTNKMGATQFLTKRLEATVSIPGSSNLSDYEYYIFYFKNAPDCKTLKSRGITYLNRYHYDGFRGSKTFGLPFIKHGNIIYISDSLLPERNGHYMVKAVHHSFSIDSGLRQDIELHFRTDNIPSAVLQQAM